MNIGDILHTSAEREAAPVGAVIHLENHTSEYDRWTKQADGRWRSGDGSHRPSTGGSGWCPDGDSMGYVVDVWPSAPAVAHLQVGDVVRSAGQFVALPVGSVVHSATNPDDRDYHWAKEEEGAWRNQHTTMVLATLNPEGFFSVRSLPETPLVMAVGDHLTLTDQREAAPIGTRIRPSRARDRVWRKAAADRWIREDDETHIRTDQQDGGWYSGQRDHSIYYYEVLAWPTRVEQTVEGMVADYAALLGLPVGAQFHAHTQPSVRWVVGEGCTCVREGDPVEVRLNLSVFEGPANGGHLRTVVPVVALPEVGGRVTDREQFFALPVGTVLSVTGQDYRRTKLEGDRWFREGRSDTRSDTMRLNYYSVVSVPDPAPAAPEVALPAIGEGFMTREQIVAAPIGTVVRANGRTNWTKEAGGWLMEGGRGHHVDSQMSLDGYNVVVSYPGTEVAEEVFITTADQAAALPLGTTIVNPSGIQWTKHSDGWGVRRGEVGDSGLRLDRWWRVVEPVPAGEGVFTIGMDIVTVEQYAALPVYSVVFRSNEPQQFPVVKRAEGAWQDHTRSVFDDRTMAGYARTLVALPQHTVAEVVESVEATITVAEHEARLATALRGAQERAVTARNEEFLSALRDAWDGSSFNEGEINDVLSELGLGEIEPTETVTVSVKVTGHTTLDSDSTRSEIEGDLSMTLDSAPVVRWALDYEIEFEDIEVGVGECGCSQVGDYDVRVRLDNSGVSYDGIDFEASCPNC